MFNSSSFEPSHSNSNPIPTITQPTTTTISSNNSNTNSTSTNNSNLKLKNNNNKQRSSRHSRTNSLPILLLSTIQEESTLTESNKHHKRNRSFNNRFSKMLNNNNIDSFNNDKDHVEAIVEAESSDMVLKRLRNDFIQEQRLSNEVSRSNSPVIQLHPTTPSSPSKKTLDYWNQQLLEVDLTWKRASSSSSLDVTSTNLNNELLRPRSQSLNDMVYSSSSTSSKSKNSNGSSRLRASVDTLPNLGSVWQSFLEEADASFEDQAGEGLENIELVESPRSSLPLSYQFPIVIETSSTNLSTTTLNSSITSSNRSISPFGLTSPAALAVDPFSQPSMFSIPIPSTSSSNPSSLAERRDKTVAPLVFQNARSSPFASSNSSSVSSSSSSSASSSSSDEESLSPSKGRFSPKTPPVDHTSTFNFSTSSSTTSFPSSTSVIGLALNSNDFSDSLSTTLPISKLTDLSDSFPPLSPFRPSFFPTSTITTTKTRSRSVSPPISPPPSSIFSQSNNFPSFKAYLSSGTMGEGYDTDASSLYTNEDAVDLEDDDKSNSRNKELDWSVEVEKLGVEFERLGAGSRSSFIIDSSNSNSRNGSSIKSNSSSSDDDEEVDDEDDTIKVHQPIQIQLHLPPQQQSLFSKQQYYIQQQQQEVEEEGRIEWGVAL